MINNIHNGDMMQRSETVVPPKQPLTKQKLHALVMCGWNRAIAKLGKGAFADKLGLSDPAINKQLAGSMPGLEYIDMALDIEPTLLDDWLAAKGLRIVDKEAVCDTDDASVLIAKLMVWLAEAQHPDSPGGRRIVHSELVGAEALIRQLHGATGNWLGSISQLRRVA